MLKPQITNSLLFVLLGLLVGLFVGVLVTSETSNMVTPNNLFYHYDGLIGGLCTLIAAFIAAGISYFLFVVGREKSAREEENFREILKQETGEVHRQLERYVNHIENENGTLKVETNDLRPKADEVEFQIPASLYDFNILSKLRSEKIGDVIRFREDLENIKRTYYSDDARNSPPAGLYKDSKQALDSFRAAFGVLIRVDTTHFNLDAGDADLTVNRT